MAGYTERTVRLEFPELGEGCFVRIRNPLLMPLVRPEKDETLYDYGVRQVRRLIIEWNVWGYDDDSDNA